VSNVTGPVAAAGPRYRGAAPRNVVLLGLTSFFTDISSEALTAVLPLYFVLELRMTPDEPWKVEDRGEKPAIALKGR
jgi:hypothetical protein